jgi:phenylacetate-CoA ligase
MQNFYISMFGYYWKYRRYGGCFKQKLNDFKAHEKFSKIQWEEYQNLELRKLLIHAFTTVPYYENTYKKYGITIKDLEKFTIHDLYKLPYLEKEDVRKYGTSLLLSKKREKGKFYSTSGSTGTPIQIYFSKKFHQTWSALYEARVRNWAGVNYKMSRAMIGGKRVIATSELIPPYYRFNIAESQAYFSAYHISESTTKDYVNGLIKTKPLYLVGYAMSIYLLAKNIEKLKLNTPKLISVLTSSEKLTLKMKTTIEKVFGCKVYDGYSGLEACGLISEYKDGALYFSPDSGVMEVVNEKGNSMDFGETGAVIATGFLNYDQPLIRYRIGDTVKTAKNQNNDNGINMLKIDEIIGRTEDVIIGANGQKMVRFHSIFTGISSIIMSQVIQKTKNKIFIKLVVDSSYKKENEQIINHRIKTQLGEVSVQYLYVDTIDKNKNGKYKAVISNLKNE